MQWKQRYQAFILLTVTLCTFAGPSEESSAFQQKQFLKAPVVLSKSVSTSVIVLLSG
jgi:hypothetical protein